MTLFDVTAIGEGGVRLSVPAGERLERADAFDVGIAGTEANVLSGLASLGWRTSWTSALPDSALGRRVAAQLVSYGVDLSSVRRVRGARLGIYFVEYACPPRATQVSFDRADTAFALMRPEEVDWDRLLDTRLLHLTGLTAALSPSVNAIVTEAVRRAKDAGVPISFDVNYRQRLWDADEAARALRPMVEAADILFCKGEDARLLFGIEQTGGDGVRALAQLTGARCILETASEEGTWSLINGLLSHTKALPVRIIDRLGAGDGFAAGFLHGWLKDDLATAPQLACAMAALALSQRGEQVVTTGDELTSLLGDPGPELAR